MVRKLSLFIMFFAAVQSVASAHGLTAAVVWSESSGNVPVVFWEKYSKAQENKPAVKVLKQKFREITSGNQPDIAMMIAESEAVNEVRFQYATGSSYEYLFVWDVSLSTRYRLESQDRIMHIMEETSGSAKEKRRFLDQIFQAYAEAAADQVEEVSALIRMVHLQTQRNIRLTLKNIDDLSELSMKSEQLADDADLFYRKTRKAAHPCCDCCYVCEVGCRGRKKNRCLFF